MDYIKRLPGFRSGSPIRMVLATMGYLFLLLVVIGVLIPNDEKPDTSAAAPATATATAPSEPEPTPTPSGPVVSDSAINETVSLMTEYDGVEDAVIVINGSTITIDLHVRANMNSNTARDHLDSAVRFLASQSSLGNDGLNSPSNEYLGGLWDHYRLESGAWIDTETAIVRGVKETSDASIRWE